MLENDSQKKIGALVNRPSGASPGSVNKVTQQDESMPQTPDNAGPIPIDPDDGWLKRKDKGYLNKRAMSAMGDLTSKDKSEAGDSNLSDNKAPQQPNANIASGNRPDAKQPSPNVPKARATPKPFKPPTVPKFKKPF